MYCYIEAKHTLHLLGDDSQSLKKAFEQTSNVKKLASIREDVGTNQITPYHRLGKEKSRVTPNGFPEIQNPFFTVIIANQVKDKKTGKVLVDAQAIIEEFANSMQLIAETNDTRDNLPDLIVLGRDVVILPTLVENNADLYYLSPFFLPKFSIYGARVTDGLSFGVALISIMWAIDWIHLGTIQWKDILTNALDLKRLD